MGLGDFNNDGISDLLWRRASTGVHKAVLMNADLTTGDWRVLGGSTDLQIVGLGDFNGDGIADTLWRRLSSGVHKAVLMNADLTTGDWRVLGGSTDLLAVFPDSSMCELFPEPE